MKAETAPTIIDILRNTSYGMAFLFSADFLGLDGTAGSVLLLLMVADFITGTIRSAVVNGLPTLKSSVGTKGLLAKILVIVGIISLSLSFKGVGIDPGSTMSGIVSIFILAEAYSILGNIHSTLTRQPKSEYDAVAVVIKIVRSALDKLTDKTKI